MLPSNHLDRIHFAFHDTRLVANAGLILPATLAQHLGLPQLVQEHLDLGDAPDCQGRRENVPRGRLDRRVWTVVVQGKCPS